MKQHIRHKNINTIKKYEFVMVGFVLLVMEMGSVLLGLSTRILALSTVAHATQPGLSFTAGRLSFLDCQL
jgi:hypothetical protein